MKGLMPSLVAVALAALALAAPAQDVDNRVFVDTDVTGNWYEPHRPGHGLQIEMLNLSEALVTWYTYDSDGQAQWLLGLGEVQGDSIRAEMRRYHGARFPDDFDPQDIQGAAWGHIHFGLTGCDTAVIAYTPADGYHLPAEFPLERLTRVDGSRCPMSNTYDETRSFNLNRGPQGFTALFLDYWDGEEDFLELDSWHGALPGEWSGRDGIGVSGNNRTDDLMMVLKRPLDGLAPNTPYRLELEMQFATNVPAGCVGVGGAPGESVFMRLGASGEQPGYVLEDSADGSMPPMRRPSIDLGQQSQPGAYALAVGDMANRLGDEWCGDEDAPWQLKRVTTSGQFLEVTSDDDGRIWVYGLSDSGFEATTTWFMTEFVVRLSPAG
jgi:hypothetical protein